MATSRATAEAAARQRGSCASNQALADQVRQFCEEHDDRGQDRQVCQAEQAPRTSFVSFLQRTDWRQPGSMLVREKGCQPVRAMIHKRTCVHTLRHLLATYLLLNGVDIRQIQVYLGPANVEPTMVYMHVVEELRTPAVSPFDRLRRRKDT